MERSVSEDDQIADNGGAPDPPPTLITKRKRSAINAASSSVSSPGGLCNDDTVSNILARLPASTAIACTALSKHHRSLIRSREFTVLHHRLCAPLPSPNIAYLVTAPIRRRHEQEHPASLYYGFHLAGAAGLTGGNGYSPPIRSLAGWRYLETKYVNTCNGVVLLAPKDLSGPCQCTLWNPALADAAREATISEPRPPSPKKKEKSTPPVVLPKGTGLQKKDTQFLALGLGYGQRSNTYKLLLFRRDRFWIGNVLYHRHGKIVGRMTGKRHQFEYSLVVHSLGGGTATGDDKETLVPLRTVLSMETVLSCKEEVTEQVINARSLYMDGTIYVLHVRKKDDILAFDVEGETVQTIDLPGDEGQEAANVPSWARTVNLELIEMSGRPCLVIAKDNDCLELWLLTANFQMENNKKNYQLEPMHVISYEMISVYDHTIAGFWDCSGGILFLWFNSFSLSTTDKLFLYDVKEKKLFRAHMPRDLAVNKFDYMLCWGYKPTLVSPESIVGEFSQDMEQRRGRSAHIAEVINPVLLQDRRKGQKATLNTVCLMEFLVRIMQKLPHDLQDVVEMPKMDSEEPGSLFKCVVSFSD